MIKIYRINWQDVFHSTDFQRKRVQIMAQEMTTNPNANLPTFGATAQSDQMFDGLVRAAFLSRVQLCGGNNALAQEGKISVGHFAFIRNKDDFVALSNEYQFYPLAYRFVALRFGTEQIDSYYNPESPEFKEVMAESEEKDSKCAYGPQFLIWVPSVKDFATFLFGSKSARPEGRNMKRLLDAKSAGTMKSRLVSTKEYKWHVPVCIPYASPIEPFDVDTAKTLAEKFMNPGESESEKADFPPAQAGAAAPADGARAR